MRVPYLVSRRRVDGVRVDGYLRSTAPTTGQRVVRINLTCADPSACGGRPASPLGCWATGTPWTRSIGPQFPKSFKHSRILAEAECLEHSLLTPATRRAAAKTGRFWRAVAKAKSAVQQLGSDRPQRRVETASARVRTAPVKSTRGEGPPRTGFSGEPRATPKRENKKKAARAALRASFWEAARKRGALSISAAH